MNGFEWILHSKISIFTQSNVNIIVDSYTIKRNKNLIVKNIINLHNSNFMSPHSL